MRVICPAVLIAADAGSRVRGVSEGSDTSGKLSQQEKGKGTVLLPDPSWEPVVMPLKG